ncbi:MAG: tetratricopeptide repeat protein [Thermoleophilia bacterium]|nr:tetratricopeptide repeat protein [Thermoleophilia bacterium]
MLLDQKRTQRIVKISAILTSIAFGGIALVAIVAIIFGGLGGSTDATKERVDQARERTQSQPTNAAAWDQLATAEYAAGHKAEAIAASRKAITLAPNDFSRTQTLVRIYTQEDQPDQAMRVVSAFIDKNPRNADAYLQLGGAAEAAGKTQVARLAYQKFLELDPNNPSAAQVRDQLKTLGSGAG